MKKVLWAVGVSLLAVPTLFAQTTSQLEGAIKREVAKKVCAQTTEVTDRAVLIQLQTVRKFVKKSQTKDISLIMQSVVMLADSFFDYIKNGGTNVRLLVRQIETPMEVGWSDQEVFVVSAAIDEFAGILSHEWGSKEPTDELVAFREVLKQYPPMNDQEAQEYSRLQLQLGHFRSYVESAPEENMLIVMQSLVYLADAYAANYAKNPAEINDRFEAKNPELAASVAREIDQEIKVGWAEGKTIKPSDYIGRHLYQVSQTWKSPEPADELDTFAKVLVKAAKKK